MPQKEDDGMDGTTTLQSVATEQEAALFHFQTREAAGGGCLGRRKGGRGGGGKEGTKQGRERR